MTAVDLCPSSSKSGRFAATTPGPLGPETGGHPAHVRGAGIASPREGAPNGCEQLLLVETPRHQRAARAVDERRAGLRIGQGHDSRAALDRRRRRGRWRACPRRSAPRASWPDAWMLRYPCRPSSPRALWRARATLHVVVATAFDSGEGADGRGDRPPSNVPYGTSPSPGVRWSTARITPARGGTGVMGAGRLVRRTVRRTAEVPRLRRTQELPG